MHATAPSWEETDWLQIVTLYELSCSLDSSRSPASTGRSPSPSSATQAEAALADVERLAEPLAATTSSTPPAPSCSPWPAATTRPPRPTASPGLTANDAERRLLTTRLHRHPLDDGS